MQAAAAHDPPDEVGLDEPVSSTLPAGLVVGLIGLAAGMIAVDALWLARVDERRLRIAEQALHLTGLALALSGAMDLHRRRVGPAPAAALLVVALATALLGRALGNGDLSSIAMVAVAVAIVAQGWCSIWVRVAAPPVVVAAALVFPPDRLERWMDLHLTAHVVSVGGFASIGLIVLADALLRRPLVVAPAWQRAGSGLRWAGWALVAHVGVAVAAGLLAVVATVEQSTALFRIWSAALPVGFVVVGGNLACALVRAADPAPPLRLHLAAGLVGWAVLTQTIQLVLAAELRADDLPGAGRVLAMFSVAKVIAGTLAAACLISAISAVASRLRLRVTPRAVALTACVFGLGALVAGLGAEIALTRPGGTIELTAVVLAAIAALSALLSAAVLTLRLVRDQPLAAPVSRSRPRSPAPGKRHRACRAAPFRRNA